MTHPFLSRAPRAGLAAWAASSWRRCSGAEETEFSRKRYLGAARPVFMLRVVSRLVRPEFRVVVEIVAAKA